MAVNPFADMLADLERAAAAQPGVDLARHRLVLRACANVVQAGRSAVAAHGLPGNAAGVGEALEHLDDNIAALDSVVRGDGVRKA